MRHLEVRSYSSAGFLCSGCSLVARVAPPWWNFKLTQKAFVRVYFILPVATVSAQVAKLRNQGYFNCSNNACRMKLLTESAFRHLPCIERSYGFCYKMIFFHKRISQPRLPNAKMNSGLCHERNIFVWNTLNTDMCTLLLSYGCWFCLICVP